MNLPSHITPFLLTTACNVVRGSGNVVTEPRQSTIYSLSPQAVR